MDTTATILLVNVGSTLRGRIVDLSLTGCRIRTDERIPVGIYTRVETEFRLEGLAFRLGGVIQSIHDRNNVGIRFLDLSERKREQVLELIDEMKRCARHSRQRQTAVADAKFFLQIKPNAPLWRTETALAGGISTIFCRIDLDGIERRRILAIGRAFNAQHIARLQLDASSIRAARSKPVELSPSAGAKATCHRVPTRQSPLH